MLLLGSFLCFHRALAVQRKFELHILEHLEVALSLTCMVSQESVLGRPWPAVQREPRPRDRKGSSDWSPFPFQGGAPNSVVAEPERASVWEC